MKRERHRKTGTAEYRTWAAMKNRCYNPNTNDYIHYGGRGISVCEAWKNSFPTFLKDMGLKPSPKHSIDRIDSNGNYCPENCRWATVKEQRRNRSNAVWITHNGETLNLTEWSEKLGLSMDAIRNRMEKGIPLDKNREDVAKEKGTKLITFNGETKSIVEWAKFYHMKAGTLAYRLRVGWSMEQAVKWNGRGPNKPGRNPL